MTRYIVLDIETANLDMEAEGLQFGNPNGWQTSCVCLYDFWLDEGVENGIGHYYVSNPEEVVSLNTDLETYNIRDLSELRNDLIRFFNKDYTLVSKNGLGFDLPILAKSLSDGGADCQDILARYELTDRHIDICYLLKQQYGYRFSLQNLVTGLYGDSDSKTMAAASAPILWSEKEYGLVLDYCMHDCVLTGKVFVDAPQRSFEAKGKKNGKSQVMIISPNWSA
jgi:hypothetical protein